MIEPSIDTRTFRAYPVWDVPTRLFHWINFLCVLGLMVLGLLLANDDALGLESPAKILLKTAHVWVGYLFCVNLLWRLIWAFIGNRFARWGGLLPGGSGYVTALKDYVAALRQGNPVRYQGHNPLGRLALLAILGLLITQAVTGLVLAGTDLFYPPLGGWIAQWIAAPGVDPATLVPYAKEMYEATAFAAMRAFRHTFIEVHETAFFGLCIMIVLHLGAVVLAELREEGGLVSAMFSGRKFFSAPPKD
jgi:cytochrome b